MFGIGRRDARIDALALGIAEEIAQRFPPVREDKAVTKKTVDKIIRAFETAAAKASLFQREEKLGIYGKARLLATFKGEMQRLGYSENFIRAAVSALTNSVAAQR